MNCISRQVFRQIKNLRKQSQLLKLSCMKPLSSQTNFVLEGAIDHHNGMVVNAYQVPLEFTEDAFLCSLKSSISQWKTDNRRAVWLHIPIMHSKFMASAAQCGFSLHHCDDDVSVMTLWLDAASPNMLPLYATHQMGVAGIVYRPDKQQVLLVQDSNKPFDLWKFPGGAANLGENIGNTAVREVHEETGIETEFQSILAFRQQHRHPGAFGRSDIFIACRMTPLTFDIRPCDTEIQASCWMNLGDIATSRDTAPIVTRLSRLFAHGVENGFETVDIVGEEMTSVYRGLRYHIYHRPFTDTGNRGGGSEHEDRYDAR